MKSIIFFLVFSFIAIIVQTNEISATCDYGYTPFTTHMNINGCDVTVNTCYKCSPMGRTEAWITIESYSVEQNCTMNPQLNPSQLMGEITTNLVGSYNYVKLLCWNNDIPPCAQHQWGTVTVWEPMCMQKMRLDGKIIIVACDNTKYCSTTYNVCYDYQGDGFVMQYVSHELINPSGIECEEIDPPDPTHEYEKSECFLIETRCN